MARRFTGPGRVSPLRPERYSLRFLLWNFDFDWHRIKHEHREWLWCDPADLLTWSNRHWVLLRGFASRQGDRGYNESLSNRRAGDVKNELCRAAGKPSLSCTILPLGETLRSHPYGHAPGTDEDIHRSVEVSIYVGPGGPPPPPEHWDFEDEIVPGRRRPNRSYRKFKESARRHAPRIPPMPQRSTSDDIGFLRDLLKGLWDLVIKGGNPASEGLGTIWDALTALDNGDERNKAVVAVLGYADTIGRIAENLPPTPRNTPVQLPQPIVPVNMERRFMGMQLSLDGYREGYWRVNALIRDLDSIREPGVWPSEHMIIGLRQRFAPGEPGQRVRTLVCEGVMRDVLGLDWETENRASVSPRQTP